MRIATASEVEKESTNLEITDTVYALAHVFDPDHVVVLCDRRTRTTRPFRHVDRYSATRTTARCFMSHLLLLGRFRAGGTSAVLSKGVKGSPRSGPGRIRSVSGTGPALTPKQTALQGETCRRAEVRSVGC